jgi:hypothetical protein
VKISHKSIRLSQLTKKRERIHLNPSWQRGPVWARPKQSLLIDSILRGYDIPMIYLRETLKNTPHDFEVVDGQQRLRAIWEYMDGSFALSKGLEKFGTVDGSSKYFHELPLRMQRLIANVGLVTAIVKDAQEPEISRLFSRMQMGVRLNPPELRNAVQKPLRHAVDGVAREHPFFKDSKIQAARFRRQDYLAHAFSHCFHDCAVDLKAPQLMEDYETVTAVGQYRQIIADLHDILDFMLTVNVEVSRRLTQKWIFVDLIYLLHKSGKKMSRMNSATFAATYLDFDRERLTYNAVPERLLDGTPSRKQKDLYAYIQAFKLTAGDKKSLKTRHNVLAKRFAKEIA